MTKKEIQMLVDEAGVLTTWIRDLTKAVKPMKESLTDVVLDTGEIAFSGEAYSCSASISECFDPIDPAALFDKMKAAGKTASFLEVLRVDMTKLRKVLAPDDIKLLQGGAVGDKVSLRFKEL